MARLAIFLCIAAVWAWGVSAAAPGTRRVSQPEPAPHVLVVGTGMAGLSAALEAAQSGARVTVIEMWSVYGGTSFISGGKVAIVGTALQQRRGINDSPDLAFQDFMNCGQDHDRKWVRYYVDRSNEEIYQWLTAAGVRFDLVVPFAGNSVPRGHGPKELGVGLVSPLFRACASHPSIRFVWNVKVVELTSEDGRVAGVRGVEMRTGLTRGFRANAVILATGGFQSDLKMIREFWPKSLPLPERVLTGSGVNSLGIGHGMLRRIGAEFHLPATIALRHNFRRKGENKQQECPKGIRRMLKGTPSIEASKNGRMSPRARHGWETQLLQWTPNSARNSSAPIHMENVG